MSERTHFPCGQEMYVGARGIAVRPLIEKKREFTCQRFGLARERCNRKDRTLEVEHGFAQHQGVGGALEAHNWKAPLVAGLEPRLEFATRFFEAALQCSKT